MNGATASSWILYHSAPSRTQVSSTVNFTGSGAIGMRVVTALFTWTRSGPSAVTDWTSWLSRSNRTSREYSAVYFVNGVALRNAAVNSAYMPARSRAWRAAHHWSTRARRAVSSLEVAGAADGGLDPSATAEAGAPALMTAASIE